MSNVVFYLVEVTAAKDSPAITPYKLIFYHPSYDPKTLNRGSGTETGVSAAARFPGPAGDMKFEGGAWCIPFGSVNAINPNNPTSTDSKESNKYKLDLTLVCHIPVANVSAAKLQHLSACAFYAIQWSGTALGTTAAADPGTARLCHHYKVYRGDDVGTTVYGKTYTIKYIITNAAAPTPS